jgi:hypothetical protein
MITESYSKNPVFLCVPCGKGFSYHPLLQALRYTCPGAAHVYRGKAGPD